MTIHVEQGNRARALYERLGFEPQGEPSGVHQLFARAPRRTGATRRQVLQAGVAGGVVLWLAGAPTRAADALAAPAPGADAPHLHRGAWVGQEGAELAVAGGPRLRLDAVADVANAAQRDLAGSDVAFVLGLSGDAAQPLEQGVHRLTTPAGAGAEQFLVPVGAPDARQAYEVVVDRSIRLASAEVPRPPAGPAPATPAPVAPVSAGAPLAAPHPGAAEPDARFGFLQRAAVERGRPGLRARLRIARGSGLEAVAVRVVREGVVYARGRAPVRHRRAFVGMKKLRPLPRGRYDLVVEARHGDGTRTTVRRSVMIR